MACNTCRRSLAPLTDEGSTMTTKQTHTVTTDALATLGTIIDETAGRDAIHLAVEPVVAGERLFPGDHVGHGECGRWVRKPRAEAVGIVDPFLDVARVQEGERFWLVIYPRQITSLRHVWEHPAFVEAAPVETPEAASRRWIEEFADKIDQTYNALMRAADRWFESTKDGGWGDYTYDNGESYKGYWDQFPEFWKHYAIVTGKEIAADKRESFFTCSC